MNGLTDANAVSRVSRFVGLLAYIGESNDTSRVSISISSRPSIGGITKIVEVELGVRWPGIRLPLVRPVSCHISRPSPITPTGAGECLPQCPCTKHCTPPPPRPTVRVWVRGGSGGGTPRVWLGFVLGYARGLGPGHPI